MLPIESRSRSREIWRTMVRKEPNRLARHINSPLISSNKRLLQLPELAKIKEPTSMFRIILITHLRAINKALHTTIRAPMFNSQTNNRWCTSHHQAITTIHTMASHRTHSHKSLVAILVLLLSIHRLLMALTSSMDSRHLTASSRRWTWKGGQLTLVAPGILLTSRPRGYSRLPAVTASTSLWCLARRVTWLRSTRCQILNIRSSTLPTTTIHRLPRTCKVGTQGNSGTTDTMDWMLINRVATITTTMRMVGSRVATKWSIMLATTSTMRALEASECSDSFTHHILFMQ